MNLTGSLTERTTAKYYRRWIMNKENPTKKYDHRIMTVLLALLLAMLIFTAMPKAAFAEEVPPPGPGETQTEEGSETEADPGADDIDTGEEPYVLASPPGSAEVTEVADTDSGTGETQNSLDEPESFTSDLPSVTVTQVYDTDPRTDTSAVPVSTTAVVTGTEDIVSEEDLKKTEHVPKETTYSENTPIEGQFTKTQVTESENALQKAVAAALKKAGEDTESVTVTVAEGEYIGDLVISTDGLSTPFLTGDAQLREDFRLFILSAGSYELPAEGELIDKSGISPVCPGAAVVNGNITIRGINVVMAGISLADGKTVTLEGGDEFTWYGSQGDDVINVTVKDDGYSVKIDSGDGNDNVTVNANASAETDVKTGAGNDSVTYVTGGHQSDSNALDAKTGEGSDTIAVTVNTGSLVLDIDTGAGNDSVSLNAGEKAGRGTVEHVSVKLGAGDDTLNADTSFAAVTGKVYADAGEGFDTLVLTGSLAADDNANLFGDRYLIVMHADRNGSYKEEKDLTGFKEGVQYYAKASNGAFSPASDFDSEAVYYTYSTSAEFKTALNAFESFKDSLLTKRSVSLERLTGSNVSSFTNYVYSAKDGEALKADWGGMDVFLTNLTITGDEYSVAAEGLKLPSVNLKLRGRGITVKGALEASSIEIVTEDSDALFGTGPNAFTDALELEGGYSGSLFDFDSNAYVTIEQCGSITASSGSIVINVSVTQTHDLVDLLGPLDDDLNFFNIKVGSAVITVNGSMTSAGEIVLTARSDMAMEVSNEKMASLFVPVAFVVGVPETGIVINGAYISAGTDFSAAASTAVTMTAQASTGSLPVAVSVAVGVTETYVQVTGDSVITAGGSVLLSADATAVSSASAKKGDMQGTSGGFIAVEVAVQDTSASVSGTSSVTAGGDITIRSNSVLNGSAVAFGSEDAQGAGTASGTQSIKDMITSLRDTLLGTLKDKVVAKLTGVAEQIGGKEHKVNTAASSNGTITSPASANGYEFFTGGAFAAGTDYYTAKRTGVGSSRTVTYTVVDRTAVPAPVKGTGYYVKADPVKFKVIPNEGYTVDTVRVKYLVKGEPNYRILTVGAGLTANPDGTYSFEMPEYDVTIEATFREGTGSSSDAEIDSDAGISDLFDDATGSATDDGSGNRQTVDSDADDAVTVEIGYTDRYEKFTGTAFEEGVTYYKKAEQGEGYVIVEGEYVSGTEYFVCISAFEKTSDLEFEADKTYFR